MYNRQEKFDRNHVMEDIAGKLTRIETRMMRGFEALGVNVKATPGWMLVDEVTQTIVLNSDHYTLYAINEELDRLGVVTNGQYEVKFQNRVLCYL